MKQLASSGSARKLLFLFTHFELEAENLPSISSQTRHVLSSLRNKVNEISAEIGPVAARLLNAQVDSHSYFFANLNDYSHADEERFNLTVMELRKLIDFLMTPVKIAPPNDSPPIPVYAEDSLRNAIRNAVGKFTKRYLSYLGTDPDTDFPKVHWATVKALCRRIAEGISEDHGVLMPASRLRTELETSVGRFLQNPTYWASDGDELDKDNAIMQIATRLSPFLQQITSLLIVKEPRKFWRTAFEFRGTGSTYERAQFIKDHVIKPACTPKVDPSDGSIIEEQIIDFLRDLAQNGHLFLRER